MTEQQQWLLLCVRGVALKTRLMAEEHFAAKAPPVALARQSLLTEEQASSKRGGDEHLAAY